MTDTTTLHIRTISPAAVAAIKHAAGARGWTIATYVTRLAMLHEAARTQADNGDTALQAALQKLGLETKKG